VAPICDRLYRRLATCGAFDLLGASEVSSGLPITNRRYRRLELGATRISTSFCRWVLTAAIFAHCGIGRPLRADDTDDTIKRLQRQIEALDEKLRELERKRELDVAEADVRAKSSPRLTAGPSGFALSSADTNFVLRIRGGAQADSRFYFGGGAANDTFLIRRARPILEGTVFRQFDYRIMLDVSTATSSSTLNNGFLLDSYVDANLAPEFRIRAGKFKEPVGLERLQSWNNLLFLERNYPTQLVPNRDVGFMAHGELFRSRLQYQVGVFNGTFDSGSSDFDQSDNDKDVAARIFAQPFLTSDAAWLKGFGVGASGTWGDHGGAPRTYLTPGAQRVFGYFSGVGAQPNVLADGRNWRLSPQGFYYWGPFGLFGEYVISSQELRQAGGGAGAGARGQFKNAAWQVAASWFLTGEDNSWKAVTPVHPLGPANGGWGAWELAGRIARLSLDDAAFPIFADPSQSARSALSWGLGLNWHLNRNVKVQLNYEQSGFDGGGANPALAHKERVLLSRVQFTY
jgi:phosphate-selective porin OprO/OprP